MARTGADTDIFQAIGELIDERADRSLDEQKQDQRIDVLQHMLDNGTRPDTGERMKNQEIIDQMSELLLAGSETTSGTIGCLFLELARNPDVRAKLLKSLPVLTPSDPIIDSKRVREEPTYRYLEAVSHRFLLPWENIVDTLSRLSKRFSVSIPLPQRW